MFSDVTRDLDIFKSATNEHRENPTLVMLESNGESNEEI